MAAVLLVLCGAAAASAQSFNQAVLRYRAEQRECAEVHRQRLERNCDSACRSAADDRRQRCLASSEQRYRDVLRRALRSRR